MKDKLLKNRNINQELAIAYQNKDIISKLFGNRMKGKSLSLFGLKTNLKVVDIRPTNIPIVQARELRIDNVFELEDGSVAILDYESDYKETNFTKYGRYIMDIIDRYLSEGKYPDVRMMVVYTADIEEAKSTFMRTACTIQVEVSYLIGADSETWLKKIKESLESNTITDETLMHMILLPLTYKEDRKKQQTIKLCVDLARQLLDKEEETFVLAGILVFTDKIIGDETKQYIKEVLGMTQVGRMLMDEGRREEAKKNAKNMLKRGDSVEAIAEILELPIKTIKIWEKEFGTAVR